MDPEEEQHEEEYVIPVPEDAQDDDMLVVNICTPEEAEALLADL